MNRRFLAAISAVLALTMTACGTIFTGTGQNISFDSNVKGAEIYIDGSLAYRVDLTKDATFDILDGKMTVAVKDGRIYVAKSDCKEQLCTHASPIGNKGGTIVCLPNKVVITISAKEIDAIT